MTAFLALNHQLPTFNFFHNPLSSVYRGLPRFTSVTAHFFTALNRAMCISSPSPPRSSSRIAGQRRLKRRTGILPVSGEAPPADDFLSFVCFCGIFKGMLSEFIRVYASLSESPLNFDSHIAAYSFFLPHKIPVRAVAAVCDRRTAALCGPSAPL
jgi:hypothetical protein